MNQLTYKEAYDKIIDAYFKNEIKPLDSRFCFCGSLCNGKQWLCGNEFYSSSEYKRMESALLYELRMIPTHCTTNHTYHYIPSPGYEEKLFDGMVAALDVLKQIHISRGEIIDEPVTFKKRDLSMQT